MTAKNKIYFYSLFFFTQLVSIRFFLNFNLTKDNPIFYFLTYLLITSIIFFIFINLKLFIKIIQNQSLFFISIILFTLFILYKYPTSIGTERDDCYLIIINNLISLNYPYSTTELGDPCSTGLSSLIFYVPVIFYENYFALTTTLYFLFFYFLLKKVFNQNILRFLVYIQMFNLLFLEEAIAGSDFFFISLSYLIGIIYLNYYFKNQKKSDLFLAFVILYFFYGSRIVFIFLIPLNYILFLLLYDKKKVNNFFFFQFIISLITILIPLFFNSSGYHPLHIITKGFFILGLSETTVMIPILIAIFVVCLLIFFKSFKYKLSIYNFIKKKILSLQLGLLTFPLLMIIMVTLYQSVRDNNLYSWEGLSYLILIYPSLVFIFSTFFKNENVFNENFLNKN